MKKIGLISVLIIILFQLLKCAKTPEITRRTEERCDNAKAFLSKFIHFYYLSPKTQLVSKSIRCLNFINLNDNNALPVVSFYSVLFASNRDYSDKWTKDIFKSKPFVKKILIYAKITSHEKLLKRIKISPQQNDVYWGGFFASGETKYIDGVFNNALKYKERVNKSIFLTAWSAMWSLASLSKTHIKVKTYLENKLNTSGNNVAYLILTKNYYYFRTEMLRIIKKQRARGIWN